MIIFCYKSDDAGSKPAIAASSTKSHLAKLLAENDDEDDAIVYDLPKEEATSQDEAAPKRKRGGKKLSMMFQEAIYYERINYNVFSVSLKVDYSGDLRVLVIQPVEPNPHKRQMGITASTPHYNLQEAGNMK